MAPHLRTAQGNVLLLNGVCPYYTMFPITFPLARLRHAKPGDWVLDPFCGRGSTNYAARILGLPSLGVDSNPVAVAIAQAKMASTTPGRIVSACKRLLESNPSPHIPKGEFWSRCYHPRTLRQLCKLRAALRADCESPTRQALRALLLGRLHGPRVKVGPPSYLSNQMPRTYAAKPAYAVRFWRRHRLAPPEVDVLDVVRRKAPHYFGALPQKVPGAVICADSSLHDISQLGNTARWVITSPPYYGMRTYIPDQWLRYWFVGGPSRVAYRFEGQLEHRSPEVFAQNLACVWKNVAAACDGGAQMLIRFGGIRDRDQDPRQILWESFRLSDAGWRITTARSAGVATQGKRQAEQFVADLPKPVEEIDVYACLQ